MLDMAVALFVHSLLICVELHLGVLQMVLQLLKYGARVITVALVGLLCCMLVCIEVVVHLLGFGIRLTSMARRVLEVASKRMKEPTIPNEKEGYRQQPTLSTTLVKTARRSPRVVEVGIPSSNSARR